MKLPKAVKTKIDQACFALIALAILVMTATSCVSEPRFVEPEILRPQPERIAREPTAQTGPKPLAPTPFRLGEEVRPPRGCLELRSRGGQC